jgi:tetratricopeptide (TPR) repeat protein
MKSRRDHLIGLLLISLGFASCGGGAMRAYHGRNAIKVPPGISPLVAARADSISAGLFVAMKNEREAQTLFEKGRGHYNISDSLWLVLDNAKKAPVKSVPATDSLAAVKQTITGALKLQEAAQNLQNFDRTQEQRLMIQASYNLKEAQKYLERSVQLNPFNAQVQNYLALTYKLLAQRFPKDMAFGKALHIWGALARLEPGEYLHYYNLGSTYFAEQHWADALENFKKCEEVLLASAEVNPRRLQNPALPVEATIDTTYRFLSVYFQAQAAIKLFDPGQALQKLHHAKTLTHNPEYLAIIESNIKWINWDDGNIYGSVMKDSANALINRGQFDAAGKIYENLVSRILKTKRAKDEMSWTYAAIEYKNLNRKANAVARLYEVIQTIPKSADGTPLDANYNDYFDAYGTMCYNMGIDTLRSDRRLSYTYFAQAAEIDWSGRGKSYMFMAELSRANPQLLITNGEKAMALASQLSPDELQSLYKLLVDGYRRSGQVDKAKNYFDKLRAMQ